MHTEQSTEKSGIRRARSPAAMLAIAVTVGWIATGPVFHYANAWWFSMSTLTAIATLLVLFLFQQRRSRDITALHAQLDALAKVTDRDTVDRMRGRR